MTGSRLTSAEDEHVREVHGWKPVEGAKHIDIEPRNFHVATAIRNLIFIHQSFPLSIDFREIERVVDFFYCGEPQFAVPLITTCFYEINTALRNQGHSGGSDVEEAKKWVQ